MRKEPLSNAKHLTLYLTSTKSKAYRPRPRCKTQHRVVQSAQMRLQPHSALIRRKQKSQSSTA
jgi:hypothetical protein